MLENANKTMASLERTSATLDQLISENRHRWTAASRDSPSWARRSANCAIPGGTARNQPAPGREPGELPAGPGKPRSSPHEARPSPAASPSLARSPPSAPARSCRKRRSSRSTCYRCTTLRRAARPVDWSLRIARPRTSLVLESLRIAAPARRRNQRTRARAGAIRHRRCCVTVDAGVPGRPGPRPEQRRQQLQADFELAATFAPSRPSTRTARPAR